MNVMSVLRYTVLVVAAAAMVVGVLVIAGILVPTAFPEQYRVLMGILVFLYGLYRFVLAYIRQPGRREREAP